MPRTGLAWSSASPEDSAFPLLLIFWSGSFCLMAACASHLNSSCKLGALLSVMGCSAARTGLACTGCLLETSIPPPGHSLGWDAEQSQEACQAVFSQRNQVLHYLNWTISPLPDWPLRVTNEVENSFTEDIWLTHLCSQVAEWGLLWPLPLSLLSQHTFWDLSFLAAAHVC